MSQAGGGGRFRSLPVVEEDVRDPEIAWLNHHAVHTAVLGLVPAQLINHYYY